MIHGRAHFGFPAEVSESGRPAIIHALRHNSLAPDIKTKTKLGLQRSIVSPFRLVCCGCGCTDRLSHVRAAPLASDRCHLGWGVVAGDRGPDFGGSLQRHHFVAPHQPSGESPPPLPAVAVPCKTGLLNGSCSALDAASRRITGLFSQWSKLHLPSPPEISRRLARPACAGAAFMPTSACQLFWVVRCCCMLRSLRCTALL